VPIKEMKPAKYNPRKNLKPGDKMYQNIKNSIEKFGYIDLIIWNERTGNIVGGHQRFKILKELGYKEIECVVVDFDETNEMGANIALNKALGEFEPDSLKEVLDRLAELNFDMTPFGIEEIKGPVEDDDFDVEAAADAIVEPKSKLGEVYKLGNHRVMCGDSTNESDVGKLAGEDRADLVLTDPPYNVDYEGATKEKLKIQNDKMGDSQFLQFLTDAFTRMYEYSKMGAAIYVFHADSEGFNFRYAFKLAGYQLRHVLCGLRIQW
jgi:hypothetical protein